MPSPQHPHRIRALEAPKFQGYVFPKYCTSPANLMQRKERLLRRSIWMSPKSPGKRDTGLMTSANDLGPPLTQAQIASTERATFRLSIDEDFVQPLNSVSDPEVGLNIVDLGLVYQAKWTTDGISVSMTMTTPSCPMAEMLAEEVRAVLRRQFPDTTIIVDVSRDPPWTPARISEAGRRQLGWSK